MQAHHATCPACHGNSIAIQGFGRFEVFVRCPDCTFVFNCESLRDFYRFFPEDDRMENAKTSEIKTDKCRQALKRFKQWADKWADAAGSAAEFKKTEQYREMEQALSEAGDTR